MGNKSVYWLNAVEDNVNVFKLSVYAISINFLIE